MKDEEQKDGAIAEIEVIAELMMNNDPRRTVEFSPGVINKIGRKLSEACDLLKD